MVFDCAAKYKGTSLSDKLLCSPDLNNNLVGVLIRFREQPIAIVLDIKEIFHQVRVYLEDRNDDNDDSWKLKRNASPGSQVKADLPVDPIQPDKPLFTFVGIDFFGPLLVKQGRSRVKRYGCLFRCLVVRAIHIEIAHSNATLLRTKHKSF